MNTTPLLLTAGPHIAGLLPTNVPARPTARIIASQPIPTWLNVVAASQQAEHIRQDWRGLLDCNPSVVRIEVEPSLSKARPHTVSFKTDRETHEERMARIRQITAKAFFDGFEKSRKARQLHAAK